MTELSENILSLREQGKTYDQIVAALGCSKGTVAYHLGKGQKEKYMERQRIRRNTLDGALKHKTASFLSPSKPQKEKKTSDKTKSASRIISDKVGGFQRSADENGILTTTRDFSWEDVLSLYGEKTTCYLTGIEIDLSKPRTYEFDHIVPRALGGTNSLSNLGIATRASNRAKGHMPLDEFISLCRLVVSVADSKN